MLDIDFRTITIMFGAAAGLTSLGAILWWFAKRPREPSLEAAWFSELNYSILSSFCFFFAFAAALTGTGPTGASGTESPQPRTAVVSGAPLRKGCIRLLDPSSVGEKVPFESDGCPMELGSDDKLGSNSRLR